MRDRPGSDDFNGKYSNAQKSKNRSNFTEDPHVVSFLRHHIAVRTIDGANEVIRASGDS